MTEQEWAADRIEVAVSGCFTTRHELYAGEERLGELIIPTFARTSTFQGADGRRREIVHTSFWRGTHEMSAGGQVLGRAEPRGFWHRELELQFEGQAYRLQSAGFFTRAWKLVAPDDTVLLQMKPQGAFRRGAYLEIYQELPVDLLVFTYYLVRQRWQTETAAAASAAAAS